MLLFSILIIAAFIWSRKFRFGSLFFLRLERVLIMEGFLSAKRLQLSLSRKKLFGVRESIILDLGKYLFYGQRIEHFSYMLLAKLMKVHERVVLIGVGDYHDGYLFDLNVISEYLLAYGIEPIQAFENILIGVAYNLRQFEKLVELVKTYSKAPLIVINVERLTKDPKLMPKINNVVWKLLKDRKAPTFFTTTANMGSTVYPPKPNTSHFLRHTVDVVAFVKQVDTTTFVIYVLKHPLIGYRKILFGVDEQWGETLQV